MIYVSKVFKSSATGRRLKSVTCEKCGTGYFYLLVRVGTGKEGAPYFLGQAGAAERARSNAETDLAWRLEREAELVPCPKCGWVNHDLVKRHFRRKFRRSKWIAAGVAIAGGIAAWIEWITSQDQKFSTTTLVILAAGVLGAGVVLGLQWWRRQWLDPNRNYPARTVVPPGTPLALVERRDARTGETYLEPVSRPASEPAGSPAWAVFPAGQVGFPWVCCNCLDKAAMEYEEVDQKLGGNVPLCRPCSARFTRRYRTAALLSTAGAIGLAALASVSVPGADTFGRWLLFLILSFIAWIVVVTQVPHRVSRPYRYGIVDADRAIMKFAANNPEYTELLIRKIRESGASAE
jgi:hypothetical protein